MKNGVVLRSLRNITHDEIQLKTGQMGLGLPRAVRPMRSRPPDGWLAANRVNWDQRVPVHLGSRDYDLTPLRSGSGKLFPIEEAELGPVKGHSLLHLQCHFGRDTLALAQRGAAVVGVDFSQPAIEWARLLAGELALANQARFHVCDIYDAPQEVPGGGSFDIVYSTWRTIGWLPDIKAWARVVAHFLAPGGRFYFADGHPTALVLDDEAAEADGRPGWYLPYFFDGTHVDDNTIDGSINGWMEPSMDGCTRSPMF